MEHEKWQIAANDWHLPHDLTRWVRIDHEGTLWVTTSSSIFYLPKHSRLFRTTNTKIFFPEVTESPDGTMWVAAGTLGIRRLVEREVLKGDTPPWHIYGAAGGPIADRAGGMWSAGTNGVSHTATLTDYPDQGAAEAATENFSETNGLTGNYVFTSLEGREVNIWFGTTNGLDRFREIDLYPRIASERLGSLQFPRLVTSEAITAETIGNFVAGRLKPSL
jgi:hypothetical protein